MSEFRIDDAPCGFVSFVDDGRISYINSTLLRRLGYSREELLNRHVETILAVGSRIFYQTHFFPLIKLHGHAQEIFLLLRDRDGESVGTLCNAVLRKGSEETSIDCVFMEVIERRKFEEALVEARQAAESAAVQLEAQAVELELQQAQLLDQAQELQLLNERLTEQRKVAEDANHAKSNFLAVMSHELRTPLNAIGGYTQLLDMEIHGPISAKQKETLSRIERSQKHLLRLINDVLNLARIEAGRVEYKLEPVVVAEVVGSVMPMVEPQIERKSLQFNRDLPDGLSVTADREKVQQVLLNLLTNAIKFTPQEGAITVHAGELSETRCFIRVRDTGIGIPPDMLDKVFEPFIQVESHRRSGEGSGLGLAISRDLARGMSGDLEVESTLGEGSTFILTLPKA